MFCLAVNELSGIVVWLAWSCSVRLACKVGRVCDGRLGWLWLIVL